MFSRFSMTLSALVLGSILFTIGCDSGTSSNQSTDSQARKDLAKAAACIDNLNLSGANITEKLKPTVRVVEDSDFLIDSTNPFRPKLTWQIGSDTMICDVSYFAPDSTKLHYSEISKIWMKDTVSFLFDSEGWYRTPRYRLHSVSRGMMHYIQNDVLNMRERSQYDCTIDYYRDDFVLVYKGTSEMKDKTTRYSLNLSFMDGAYRIKIEGSMSFTEGNLSEEFVLQGEVKDRSGKKVGTMKIKEDMSVSFFDNDGQLIKAAGR